MTETVFDRYRARTMTHREWLAWHHRVRLWRRWWRAVGTMESFSQAMREVGRAATMTSEEIAALQRRLAPVKPPWWRRLLRWN